MPPNAKRRADARAPVDSEVVRVADEAVVAKPKRMRELCPLCQRDLALIDGVHHCMPVWASAAPGSGRSFVTSAVTELPERIDIERINGRPASKLSRVKVNGRVVIAKTRAPFAIFGSLLVQGWSGQVELWRDRKLIGERNIEAEACSIFAAHDRLMFRKRRYR